MKPIDKVKITAINGQYMSEVTIHKDGGRINPTIQLAKCLEKQEEIFQKLTAYANYDYSVNINHDLAQNQFTLKSVDCLDVNKKAKIEAIVKSNL